MKIQELPDHKAHYSEIDKYLDEPLLEYVWEVANYFCPFVDYDGVPSESQYPVIFANRYIESKLTDEEKYARYIEFRPNETLGSAKEYYATREGLDTSFIEDFFNRKEVINTLNAFHLDLDKFLYLLLFINDVVKDVCTNAPSCAPTQVDKVNEMVKELSKATEIIMKKNGRQNYETQDASIIHILNASVTYFVKTYNNIVNGSDTHEECKAKLQELGLEGMLNSWQELTYDNKVSREKSHKTRLFAEMFQYFLKDKEADPEMKLDFTRKDSVDKLLLISRLTHIVGLQGEEYYERHILNDKGKYVANRRLSNLLSRYRDEPLPSTIGRIYCGYL